MNCWTCLNDEHDHEFHESSLRIRRWLLDRVTVTPPPVAKPRTFAPRVADVVNLGLGTVEQRKRASRLGGRAQGRR
jgi:hypothetical protein